MFYSVPYSVSCCLCADAVLLPCRSSGDPCARIWDFGPAADHSKPRILAPPANEPAGTKEPGKEQTKDVTAAEWHPSGNLIACGSFNGAIRIWRKDGEGAAEQGNVGAGDQQ